ncbi:hypothetical protein KGQ20_45330 [Catenulispora sp. NF23]|uniref:Integral membrane protein n=1 Tax=Catenulispora pinistramenti TaxID=2705254 RepID=A0ABS5L8F4_9ACTN|nr:hypothetical protein [Catenulispora pinistramenti]MBS2539989.1 hypothetical protein [Catenulispora pinistramenti]MBS2554631.1 hypothetical protein [Catenulispora pinistramenti]
MSGERLERRYRGLLRILPKSYREARGEELLSTLMEGAEEGRTRPELREVLSLARLGARARLGRAADGALVTTRTGEMVRTVALTGTALLAFVGLTQLAMIVANARSNPAITWTWSDPSVFVLGPRDRLDILPSEIPACWSAVLGLIALGRWRAARVLALLTFLVSAYLTDGMELALREETVLAGIVTAALFAVRGAHARRALVPGLLGTVAALGLGAVVYEGQKTLPPGPESRLPIRMLDVLQGWGQTENRHAMVLAALAVAAVAVLGYRSSARPVALAVVAAAAIGPDLILASQRPYYVGGDRIPLAFFAGGLVLVAALAVLKERLGGRSVRSGSSGAVVG